MSHRKALKPMGMGVASNLLLSVGWPLGNRRLMLELEEKNIHLDATQRVLGMTIGSLPVLFALAIYGFYSSGLPAGNQLISSGAAALFSGLFGSVLFYKAMQKG